MNRFEARPSKQVPQEQVPIKGSDKQISIHLSRQSFQEQVPKRKFPRENSQEQVIRQCSQEQVPKNRLPRTGSQARLAKNRFSSKVPMKKCQAMFPRTGAQARFQE